MSKYQALKEALKAGPTGDEWITDPANPNLVAVDSDPYEYICQVAPAEFSESDHSDKQERVNAAYIAAANPATISAILADLEAAEKALDDAATSLETISHLSGKEIYPNGDDTCMGTFPEVRGYATSRAGVARAALAQMAMAKGE